VNLRKECFLQALLSALNEYNLMSEIPNETEKYIDALTAKIFQKIYLQARANMLILQNHLLFKIFCMELLHIEQL